MTFTAISVLHGALVSAEEAIKIDHSSRANAFTCPECSQPVRLRTSNKRAPAYFAHAKRNTSCSLAQNAPDPSFSSEEKSEKNWSDEELFASVETYISMLEQVRSGNAVNKKQAYLDLAHRYGRTAKSYEYRMQNISYVLSLLGRTWLSGLRPAKNVGPNVASKIESYVAKIEGRNTANSASFEIQTNKAKRQKSAPNGCNNPEITDVSITLRNRDPAVKAWVLAKANGICECCGEPAPFSTLDGPFLEVHHVLHLAEGGPDTVWNTVAVCPNCHRRLHYSLDTDRLIEELYLNVERLRRQK